MKARAPCFQSQPCLPRPRRFPHAKPIRYHSFRDAWASMNKGTSSMQKGKLLGFDFDTDDLICTS